MSSNVDVFYHRGAKGDIVYSLPAVLAHKKSINFYFRRDSHVEFLYRLLEKQDYIKKVRHRREMPPGDYVNLSKFVEIALKNKSQRLIKSHLDIFNMDYDFSVPWIHGIDSTPVAEIVINRSLHYHDIEKIDWELLSSFSNKCVFIGYRNEWEKFVNLYNINISYYETKDALEVAQVIKGSKLFIGNQSSCFAIAESIKSNRVLEVYKRLDNCQPSGERGYTYLNEELINKCLNT